MKGAISIKGQDFYTHMDRVFDAINQLQISYDWLLSDYDCNDYPADEIPFHNPSHYVWISGERLSEIVYTHYIQFLFGVFSGFIKETNLEDVLQYEIPYADGNPEFWHGSPSIQHPLAEIEIVPWDGCCVLLIAKDESIVNQFMGNFPNTRDLEQFNQSDETLC